MKVEVKLDEQCEETTVTIVTKEMSDEIHELMLRLSNQQPSILIGFQEDTATVVTIERIIHAYAANQRVNIVTEDGEYLSRLRLYQLEERLPQSAFVRISNSELINLKKVRDFDLSFSGSICVRFLNGKTTYVSRRYVAKIKSILGL